MCVTHRVKRQQKVNQNKSYSASVTPDTPSHKKPLHQGPASPLRTGPKTESWAGLLLSDS